MPADVSIKWKETYQVGRCPTKYSKLGSATLRDISVGSATLVASCTVLQPHQSYKGDKGKVGPECVCMYADRSRYESVITPNLSEL